MQVGALMCKKSARSMRIFRLSFYFAHHPLFAGWEPTFHRDSPDLHGDVEADVLRARLRGQAPVEQGRVAVLPLQLGEVLRVPLHQEAGPLKFCITSMGTVSSQPTLVSPAGTLVVV